MSIFTRRARGLTGREKFEKAIAYFKNKLLLPTSNWREIMDEASDYAFTIAGVEKANVLQVVYDALQAVLEGRTTRPDTFGEFKQVFDDAMLKNGYGKQKPWRSQLVFKQNIRTAYAAGRHQQMLQPDALQATPYWQWWHGNPLEPRLHHEKMHKKVFRAADIISEGFSLPSGFSCTCRFLPLSDRDLAREGLKVEDLPTAKVTIRDKLSGKEWLVPAVETDEGLMPLVDPGFMRIPGQDRGAERKQIIDSAIARLSPALREKINNK